MDRDQSGEFVCGYVKGLTRQRLITVMELRIGLKRCVQR